MFSSLTYVTAAVCLLISSINHGMNTRLTISLGGAAAELIYNRGGGDCGMYSVIDGLTLVGTPINQSVSELRATFVQFVRDDYDTCYRIFCPCVEDPTLLMFEQRLTSTLTPGYWTDTWHLAIFSYMFKRPIEVTNLYSFQHNPDNVFLQHRCTTLDHWVALNPTIPRHEPYHDRAINLVVEMDDERTKSDRPVNQEPSAFDVLASQASASQSADSITSVINNNISNDERNKLFLKLNKEITKRKRRASRSATHSAICSTATAAKSVQDITRAADVEQKKEQRKNKRQRSAQSSILSSPSTTVADAVTHNSYIDVSIFIHTKLTTYGSTHGETLSGYRAGCWKRWQFFLPRAKSLLILISIFSTLSHFSISYTQKKYVIDML